MNVQEKRSAAGLLVPLLMLGFAGIYWFENRGVPARDMRMVTPLTIILVILSVALAVRWLAGRDRDGGEPIDLAALRRPVGLLAATLVLLFGADYDFPLAAEQRPDVVKRCQKALPAEL